jgi:hypothetical protein
MEDGFQTRVAPDLVGDYSGRENDRWALEPTIHGTHGAARRPVDQATQLEAALRLAYCQPYVGAFFNFLLADESTLTGWQSGLLWSNWQPKPSYTAFAHAVADIRRDWVDCTVFGGPG